MHFSVLTTVAPEKVQLTQEHLDRAEAAQQAIAEMSNKLANHTKAEGFDADKFNLEFGIKCARSVAQPFAALLDEAITIIMEPYSQEADEKYMEFYDETEDLQHEWETGTIDCVEFGGKYYRTYELRNFKNSSFQEKDGVMYEVTKDGTFFRSPTAQKMVLTTVSYPTFYKTFKKFASERATYDAKSKAWGYWSNPNCFYDWYSIGGRWKNLFLVKDTVTDCSGGMDSAFDEEPRSAPEGYRWTSACRIKDLAIDKMVEEKIQDITNDYNMYKAIWEAGKAPDDMHAISVTAEGVQHWGRLVFDPKVSLEEHLAKRNINAGTIIASFFHGYLDSEAMEEDEFGYCECDSIDGNWEDFINDTIGDLDPETVLVTIDCHM